MQWPVSWVRAGKGPFTAVSLESCCHLPSPLFFALGTWWATIAGSALPGGGAGKRPERPLAVVQVLFFQLGGNKCF
jgi:hypothetical protein